VISFIISANSIFASVSQHVVMNTTSYSITQ